MSFSSHIKATWHLHLLVILCYLFTIIFMVKYLPNLDIKVHNSYLSFYLEAGYFPIPPGYYAMVYLLDLVVRLHYPFVASSVLVLTFFFWWRYQLIYSWVCEELNTKPWLSFALVMSLLFLGPVFIPAVDGELWYLGKLSTLIWHNSTLIVSFPFCILLFKKTFQWFKSGEKRDYIWLYIFSVLILLIKPSFLFCYLPALPIYLFFRSSADQKLLRKGLLLSLVMLSLIALEKFLIFNWDPMLPKLYEQQELSAVVIQPMRVWLYFSQQPLFDFITSIPLLLAYLMLWRKEAFSNPYFSFSALLFGFALLIYALFAETGFREFHGNFYWQIPLTLFLMHLSILFAVGKSYVANPKFLSSRLLVLALIYLLQLGFGIAYWLRIFTGLTLS